MTKRHHKTWSVLSLAAVMVGASAACDQRIRKGEIQADRYSEYVDQDGNITLPPDYQTTSIHLGTFAVSTKPGEPPDEVHGVYARPEDLAAYQRDGRFPDGAVLVKDVYKTKSGGLTTGHASWATEITQWFVMVKDAKGRFQDDDLWGDGWG